MPPSRCLSSMRRVRTPRRAQFDGGREPGGPTADDEDRDADLVGWVRRPRGVRAGPGAIREGPRRARPGGRAGRAPCRISRGSRRPGPGIGRIGRWRRKCPGRPRPWRGGRRSGSPLAKRAEAIVSPYRAENECALPRKANAGTFWNGENRDVVRCGELGQRNSSPGGRGRWRGIIAQAKSRAQNRDFQRSSRLIAVSAENMREMK